MATRVVFEVPALHCEGCIASIASVLESLTGVYGIEGNLDRRELAVDYDLASVTPDALAKQLDMIGFPVSASHAA